MLAKIQNLETLKRNNVGESNSNLLNACKFSGRVISQIGVDMYWPPSSYDLTPFDLFLRGFVGKDLFENPTTIPKLKENRHQIVEIAFIRKLYGKNHWNVDHIEYI